MTIRGTLTTGNGAQGRVSYIGTSRRNSGWRHAGKINLSQRGDFRNADMERSYRCVRVSALWRSSGAGQRQRLETGGAKLEISGASDSARDSIGLLTRSNFEGRGQRLHVDRGT